MVFIVRANMFESSWCCGDPMFKKKWVWIGQSLQGLFMQSNRDFWVEGEVAYQLCSKPKSWSKASNASALSFNKNEGISLNS